MSALTLRRTRAHGITRALTREVRLHLDQFIQPAFVVEKLKNREPVPGLTDIYRETPDSLLKQVDRDLEAGVRAQLLFGVPAKKHEQDFNPAFTGRQIEALKRRFGEDLWLAVDVCLCSATTHGHCGVLTAERDHIDNVASVEALARTAVAYAEAGADCIAPSDMMDGRVAAIRSRLDANGFERTLIMSYAAKFQSALYGPFRIAADSAPQGGSGTATLGKNLSDRATYQIDPARPADARLSAERDHAEGADILMVKPGLLYLDVLKELSARIPRPWAVYEVSGEYAAFELLAEQGLASRASVHREAWTALTRAGAAMIITYGARHAREWLAQSPLNSHSTSGEPA